MSSTAVRGSTTSTALFELSADCSKSLSTKAIWPSMYASMSSPTAIDPAPAKSYRSDVKATSNVPHHVLTVNNNAPAKYECPSSWSSVWNETYRNASMPNQHACSNKIPSGTSTSFAPTLALVSCLSGSARSSCWRSCWSIARYMAFPPSSSRRS